jgi:hypothetical protein
LNGFIRNSTAPALIARTVISVAGDEDDGHVSPVRSNPPLQFETIDVRKAHVEHQAAGCRDSWAAQEVLRRRECLGDPAGRLDQRFERGAHRDVIVDNEYDRCGVQHDDGRILGHLIVLALSHLSITECCTSI